MKNNFFYYSGTFLGIVFFSYIFSWFFYKKTFSEIEHLQKTGKLVSGSIMGFAGELSGMVPNTSSRDPLFSIPTACEKDLTELCSQQPNLICLRDKFDKLSQDCQAKVSEGIFQELGSCKVEAETYCKDVKPGQGRMKGCLMMNKDKLSEPCHSKMFDGN